MNSSFRTVFIHEYVTGGGCAGGALPRSWAAEGNAMRRALARDFAALERTRVIVTLDARLDAEPGPWSVVRVAPNEEIDQFSRLAAECDFTLLVAPETEGILLERANILDRVGGRSLGSFPSAIALAGDKLALAEHWKRLDLTTPAVRSVVPRAGLPRAATYPAILKPRLGAGCVETFVIESADERPGEWSNMTDALLQDFILGDSLGAAFLVGLDGRAEWIGVAAQNIERDGSRLSYRGGRLPIRIPEKSAALVARAVESLPGLRGWVGVDFVREAGSGRVVLLEINPRATTSFVGWQHLLGAGRIAERWIEMFENVVSKKSRIIFHDDKVLGFDADGTIHEQGDY